MTSLNCRKKYNGETAWCSSIRISYWYTPPGLWSYYACCEKVNLDIFRAFKEQGIQLSLPFRHSTGGRTPVDNAG